MRRPDADALSIDALESRLEIGDRPMIETEPTGAGVFDVLKAIVKAVAIAARAGRLPHPP